MKEPVKPSEIDALQSWVRSLQVDPSCELRFDALSDEASLRRYFRVTGGAFSQVAVFSPPDSQKNDTFIRLKEFLAKHKVAVPDVFSFDAERGFMLQQDLGDRMLLGELNPQTVDAWYQKAVSLLKTFVSFDRSAVQSIDHYDLPLLRKEFALFEQTFLNEWLSIELTAGQKSLLETTFDYLSQCALSQPQVFVHRDFHSRNLMVKNNQLIVIDFQDAVIGPVTYDAVSLFKDCYIDWPEDQVERWVIDYYQQLAEEGLIDGDAFSRAEFLRSFHLMGLQRHLKVLGIFTRLSLQQGKCHFLPYLSRIMHYVSVAVDNAPALADFSVFFHQVVVPAFEKKQGSSS